MINEQYEAILESFENGNRAQTAEQMNDFNSSEMIDFIDYMNAEGDSVQFYKVMRNFYIFNSRK